MAASASADYSATKKAAQAWRKRPRKFAPKSRLGCKTCKIRRVKCDLVRPACIKCSSTGRACDGYGDQPLFAKPGLNPSNNEHFEVTRQGNAIPQHSSASRFPIKSNNDRLFVFEMPKPAHLDSFMILPFTGTRDADSFRFFECVSMKHLDIHLPTDAWHNTLMYFAQTVPTVRHAATALSVIYRRYADKHAGRPLSTDNWDHAEELALVHYNKAIQLLVEQHNGTDQLAVAVTILVSYLFSCIDSLLGKYVQATKHLRGGVELSQQAHRAVRPDSTSISPALPPSAPSGLETVLGQVTRQLRRLDLQATMYLVDWTPADLQLGSCTLSPDLPSFIDVAGFTSLEQAGDVLMTLVAQVMHLRNTAGEGQVFPVTEPSFSIAVSIKAGIRQRLAEWQANFDALLRLPQSEDMPCPHRGRSTPQSRTRHRVVTQLRLQHLMAMTYLASFGPAREAEYDAHLPAFRQCLDLVREIVALRGEQAHPASASSTSAAFLSASYTSTSRSSLSNTSTSTDMKPEATFTPEIGLIPVLYIIGVKCRDPKTRREAAGILRGLCMREAVWDSACAAMVVERIIEIEEQGLHDTLGDEDPHGQTYTYPVEEEEARSIKRMEQIPIGRRVEVVSWGQIVAERDLQGRVELYYTFCGEDEWHEEVMVID